MGISNDREENSTDYGDVSMSIFIASIIVQAWAREGQSGEAGFLICAPWSLWSSEIHGFFCLQ